MENQNFSQKIFLCKINLRIEKHFLTFYIFKENKMQKKQIKNKQELQILNRYFQVFGPSPLRLHTHTKTAFFHVYYNGKTISQQNTTKLKLEND